MTDPSDPPKKREPSSPDALAELSLEVRPALNAILGYAELLLREEGARLTPHGRRDLGTIQANAKNVLTLLGDLLDLSRNENQRPELRIENVRLAELVDEAIATARGLLQGKEVDLTAEIAEEALTVRTDAHLLRRLVDRLLATAARSTERGEILLSARGEGDALELVVEDTGVGVPASRVPHLFERLRAGTGASAEERRASVDLAIARQSARLLGGDAFAESTLGRGTRIRIVVPGAITGEQGPASVRPNPLPRADELGTRRAVLVVDEDPLLLAELRSGLVERGFDVVESASTSGAIDLARREVPSAILLAVHPPSLAGFTLLEELKTDPALAAVPVVVVAIGEARSKAFLFGPCEFVAEPVEPALLTRIVVRALGGTTGPALVLEPDEKSAQSVIATLRDAGLDVTRAKDEVDALALAEKARWAIVVADLAAARMGAFSLLAQLRGAGSDVPFVALTPRRMSEAELHDLRDAFTHLVARHGSALKLAIADAEKLLRAARVGEGRVPRLLYVEDSPQNRDIVRRYLRGLFDVLEAGDGAEGAASAAREQPDIILMDLSLPGMDGWEATARIKALPPLARTPVIALSAHAGRDDRERARAAGCVDYLTKPIERDELVHTLRKHLPRR